jgi:hypothetical protein
VVGLAREIGKKNDLFHVRLRLHSDGSEHVIKKMDQDYEVTEDQYCTRTQFPFAACYAMTVHKVA